MQLLNFKVQYETAQKQPDCDHGYLTIGTFTAYDETDLQQVMRQHLGYAPPIYYIIEKNEHNTLNVQRTINNVIAANPTLVQAAADMNPHLFEDRFWDSMPEAFEGTIFEHRYGAGEREAAIDTLFGSFALVLEDQAWAKERYGQKVKVRPEKKFYKCVAIADEEKEGRKLGEPQIQ